MVVSKKSFVMMGMVVGSLIGGYLPALLGVSLLSLTSIITTAVGGFLGIFITYKVIS